MCATTRSLRRRHWRRAWQQFAAVATHLEQQRHLPAGDGVKLGCRVVRDEEELVNATEEEAALLVCMAEQCKLGSEQSLLSGSRRGGRSREGLSVVVSIALRRRTICDVQPFISLQQRHGCSDGRIRCGRGVGRERRERRLFRRRTSHPVC